jgi:hypothetical protein
VKVRLMYADRDFAPDAALPVNESDLAADLELGTLLDAMAGGDKFLFGIARQGLHSGLADPAEITYRQRVLADCAAQPVTCTTSRSRRSTPTGTCSASCSVIRRTRS